MSNYKHTQLNNRMTMQNRPGLSARSGFTLTEMLVAVGLLLVIMLIFSQIFSLAVTAMTRQKGLANNDQRARTAFTVLDADLKRMSYRSVPGQGGIVPLVPGLRYNGEASATEQQGYIYYSENDPNLDTDDVLQFTVDASVTGKYPGAQRYAGQNVLPYYGRGLSLLGPSPPSLSLSVLRDQPDWDDGTPGDNVGSSEKAEVAYFLRNGTLYRRVCLLRNNKVGVPINMAEFDQGNQTALSQPAFRFPTPINDGGVDKYYPYDLMRTYSGNFYTDFDYSAHYDESPYDSIITSIYTSVPPPTFGTNLAVFHGSLSNAATDNYPLGVPYYRFGFN
ncbi:prepilin-type N-terminal cleavage/methylation domain-containing protein, partial [uncultured Rubinisphaera sp.]|uniref:PulJ/GspJ family protein n=1 Tax=uncultured Rubinisphaera sp. TaxID=1678686 RepID=UPI0030DB6AFF